MADNHSSPNPRPRKQHAVIFPKKRSHLFVDLAGKIFGRITVISFAGMRQSDHYALWNCLCECGNTVVITGRNLRSGKTQSCGCLHRETFRKMVTKHGMKRSPEYNIYHKMLWRCTGRRPRDHKYYSSRGIVVCDRWRGPDGFANFYSDMGPRPTPDHSIDRIDNDGPYSPENCRWATREEQARNQRTNRIITLHGETHCLAEWSEITGLHPNIIQHRIDYFKWDVEKALTTPPRLVTTAVQKRDAVIKQQRTVIEQLTNLTQFLLLLLLEHK